MGEIGVKGAVLLPFAEDIYRKPYASGETPKNGHGYILDAAKNNDYFYPFYFVWNDFVIPDNLAEFNGIKWHRHDFGGSLPSEPEYDYSNPSMRSPVVKLRFSLKTWVYSFSLASA